MIVTLPIGMMESNCYLVYDEDSNAGVIIDPGDPAALIQEIEKRQVNVQFILNTHGHFDHIAGNAALEFLHAPFGLHPADRELLLEGGGALWFGLDYVPAPPPTLELTEGLRLNVGSLHLEVLHTPGHTPGSVCFYIPEEQALITGDLLFAGNVGRSDLPGGAPRVMTQSLKRLLTFPPETRLYPGHGPHTTLTVERRSNPWLRWLND